MRNGQYYLLGMVLVCALYFSSLVNAAEITTPPFEPDTGTLLVRCGVLIDGLAEKSQKNTDVIIRGGRITAVGMGLYESSETINVLDLREYTCLPGLIDTHTHIADGESDFNNLPVYYTRTREEQFEISKVNAVKILRAGFTSARNVGAYIGWSGRDIRDAINRGDAAGPRMQVAGFYLTIPAGGGDLVIPGFPESDIPAHLRLGIARGVKMFRQKAQEAVAGGADVLKVIASGAVMDFGGIPGAREMTQEEIKVVVEVGRDAGLKVTAHAHGAESIKDAIKAGVDSIEHASIADDEAIMLAVKHNVAFSMDVYNGTHTATVGPLNGWPEEFLRKNDETTEVQRQVFTKALKAGVPIIFGTDSGIYYHGDNARQFEIMVQRGMSPMQAIKSATSVAAEYIGWSDKVGAIEAGRYGDLVAVKGDPLKNIKILEDIKIVIKGGQLFKLPEDL